MKIPTKGTSRYLNKDDVAEPIIVTMDCVTINEDQHDRFVLHFEGDPIKPMTLNVTNRRTFVRAFGDDDEQWHGKEIELYVNPDVTNAKGEVVGGIRIRIPATPQQPESRRSHLIVTNSAPAKATAPPSPRAQADAKPPFPDARSTAPTAAGEDDRGGAPGAP